MAFDKEAEFEAAIIDVLTKSCGWGNNANGKNVLKNYTEQQLIQNWADILFENNKTKDRLNDYPLTESEMQQIIEQINSLKRLLC